MITIEYEINGKKVKSKDLIKALKSEIYNLALKDIGNQVNKIVKPMKCTKHPSKKAKITLRLANRNSQVNIKINGCCDSFVKEIKEAIS